MNPWEGLRSFLRHYVLENVHLHDTRSLARQWVQQMPLEQQRAIPKEIQEEWEAILDHLESVNTFVPTVGSIIRVIDNVSTSVLHVRLTLCSIVSCNVVREHPEWLACDKHMCPLCAHLANEEGWRKRLKRYETCIGTTDRLIHVMSADPDRFTKIDHHIRFGNMMPSRHMCPGVLTTCLASRPGSRYTKHEQCWGELVPTPVIPNTDANKYLCKPCGDLNTCAVWRSFHQAPRILGPTAHLLDIRNPERFQARVCADDKCCVRAVCANPSCETPWFIPPEVANRLWKQLCSTCTRTMALCGKCGRLKRAPDDLFFIYCKYQCIWCTEEHRKAIVLLWRLTWQREQRWLDVLRETQPTTWLRQLYPPDKCLELDLIPGAWETLQADPRAWNTTFFLMLRFSQLPRDVWKMIMKLV